MLYQLSCTLDAPKFYKIYTFIQNSKKKTGDQKYTILLLHSTKHAFVVTLNLK